MLLIIKRMHDFPPEGTPVIFTGDHKASYAPCGIGFHRRVGNINVKRIDNESINEKIGNVTIERSFARSALIVRTDAKTAVIQPIRNTKNRNPKKISTVGATGAPVESFTTRAITFAAWINATEIPVKIEKKLSKRRSDGLRHIEANHGNK